MASEPRWRWLFFFALAMGIVIVDQLTKMWVDASFGQAAVQPLPGGTQPTPLIGDFVRIAKSYNSGGIFGLFGGSAAVLALSSTVVIVAIVAYQYREGIRIPLLTLALSLLLGGAVGNFVDRVRYGHVIDFVDMGIGDWRWYTFNVADAAISTALLLLVLLAIFGDRLTRHLEHAAG